MRSPWVKAAFILSFLWWTYLFFTTQFVVVFDSAGYEDLGKMIAHQGWVEFLRHGPQREPMFPGLVALSMKLGGWWGVSYDYPLKLTGLLFLLLTMVFSCRLMALLGVRPFISALIVLYMGLSPVMTNSSLCLWSEFAAYPWVVLAVIWTVKSWYFLDVPSEGRRGNLKTAGYAAMVALMFLLVMSVKAVAEGILIFYLWPFYLRIISSLRSRKFLKARQAAVFCLLVLVIFEGVVCAYRSCNYYYNGHFDFTNRGDWAFYGNIARRMQPLSLKSLGAAVAYVPGMGICTSIFSPDDCGFWSARHSDDIIAQKMADLEAQGIKNEDASRYYIHHSVQMMFSNPLQAVLLAVIEAHKMFFWESSLSFVAYPDWIEKNLYSTRVLYTLRLVMAILSWSACVYAIFLCCRRQTSIFKEHKQQGALLWTINFVFWYMAMYSLFFVLDRYSFPLVSLYLVLISFLLDRLTRSFL